MGQIKYFFGPHGSQALVCAPLIIALSQCNWTFPSAPMGAAVIRLSSLHTVTIYTSYYINRMHPVIIRSDNNTVETCLKPAEWEGNLSDCLCRLCGLQPNSFVLNYIMAHVSLCNLAVLSVIKGISRNCWRRVVANYNKFNSDRLKNNARSLYGHKNFFFIYTHTWEHIGLHNILPHPQVSSMKPYTRF